MDRRLLPAAVACLVMGIAAWMLWPQPNPLDGLPVDEELLTIESVSLDGESIPDWPLVMDAGAVHDVDLRGRVRAEDGTPADAAVFQPTQLQMYWCSREAADGQVVLAVMLRNSQDSLWDETFTYDRENDRFRTHLDFKKVKPTSQEGPESYRSFVGEVKVPREPGEYDLLVKAIPASTKRSGAVLDAILTRHWRIMVR